MKKKNFLCLAIDTASDLTSVACIGPTRQVVVQKNTTHEQAEVLFHMIQQAFQGMNQTPEELSLISVTIGPGSFTGVRIGLATAKALGLALNCPVVGVDNFSATAYLCSHPVKVVLDSKRDDYFTQDFDKNGKPLGQPILCDKRQLKKMLPFTACGSGAQKLAKEIGCQAIPLPAPLALAAAQFALCCPQKTCTPTPLYLREADVTLSGH